MANNNRLRQYKEKQKQYHRNRDFLRSPEIICNELRGTNIPIAKTPRVEQVESFWKPILGEASSYCKQAKWIDEYETTINIQSYEFKPILLKKVTETIWKL